MKELEKLESMKRFNSQKALKDDFVESNRSIINSNMQRRNKESMNKQSDKYDYFPFVSGDLIEQHQANLLDPLAFDQTLLERTIQILKWREFFSLCFG